MLTDKAAARFERRREFTDGETIVTEGQPGREMFIVLEGEVEICRRGASGAVVLARLGPGEFFGEMSVLESLPRDADAVARGTVRVLELGSGALLVRLRRDPSFAVEMLNRLSGRVRTLNRMLLEATGEVGPV